MKYKLITLLLLFSVSPVFSQILKIEGGTTMSYMRNKADFLSDPKFSYVGGVGIDYMERKYYNMSTTVSFLRKGGRNNNYITVQNGTYDNPATANYRDMSFGKNYFHFNTTFRGKLPLKKGHLFLGAGPKVEMLLGRRTLKAKKEIAGMQLSTLGYKVNRWSWGGIFEIGYNHYFGEKFILGLKADYMLDFKSAIQKNAKYPKMHSDSFRLMCSFGIRLYD